MRKHSAKRQGDVTEIKAVRLFTDLDKKIIYT